MGFWALVIRQPVANAEQKRVKDAQREREREQPLLSDPAIRVRLHIIGNMRIKNVCKYQSCMVYKLPII